MDFDILLLRSLRNTTKHLKVKSFKTPSSATPHKLLLQFDTNANSLLPEELLEGICLLIEKPVDLLSLALTCHRLRRIIIPAHLSKNTHTTVYLSDANVWRSIAKSPSLARGIRSLRILGGKPSSKRLSSKFHDAVNRFLNHALVDDVSVHRATREMKELRCLEMDCVVVFPRESGSASLSRPPDGAMRLFASGPVTKVKYLVRGEGEALRSSELCRTLFEPLWSFAALTEFELVFRDRWAVDAVYLHSAQHVVLMDMLASRCPQLRALTLSILNTSLGSLFKRGRWPFLAHLTLTGGLDESLTGPIIRRFFQANQSISHLSMCVLPKSKSLPPGAEELIGAIRGSRRLRFITIDSKFVQLLHPETASRIVRLSTFPCEHPGSRWNRDNLAFISGHMPALCSFSDGGMRLGSSRDIPPIPQVVHLEYKLFGKDESMPSAQDWKRVVSLFPNLMHLKKNCHVDEDWPWTNQTSVFASLADQCRWLVEIVVEKDRYRIVRGRDGKYISSVEEGSVGM